MITHSTKFSNYLKYLFTGMTGTSLRIAGLAVLLTLGVGCRTATEPVTGRAQFILTSPKIEMRMSLEAWQSILAEETESSDQAKKDAVVRVGTAITSTLPQTATADWEFRLFADERANAFCLPGGKIGVYEGIFSYVENDAELAAVISHEIAHATARHGGERLTQAMLVNLGALGLSLALDSKISEERQRWLLAYTGITTVGVLLPFSRVHEYSADEIGLIYMARAGYNPEAAISFWTRFGSNNKGLNIEFLSTHPLGEKRRNRLRELQPKALLEYEMAPLQRGFGESYK